MSLLIFSTKIIPPPCAQGITRAGTRPASVGSRLRLLAVLACKGKQNFWNGNNKERKKMCFGVTESQSQLEIRVSLSPLYII